MGTIITFYSFKGGTGRSFALVNTASLLAKSGKKVLLIDWDLDAPGLDQYLYPYLPTDFSSTPGLIEFMNEIKNGIGAGEEESIDSKQESYINFIGSLLNEKLLDVDLPDSSGMFYLRAGLQDEKFSSKVQNFNWRDFFTNHPVFFENFIQYLNQNFDFVLIDARTGHTDIGGICTMLMPEKLVLVHTMNHQSIDGVIQVAKKAIAYRRNSNDLRSLVVFPLPSRVDLDEDDLQKEWKDMYTDKFKKLIIESYSLPISVKVDKYFNNVQIRHASNYSYGEKIAIFDKSQNDRYSLSNAFKSFMVQLIDIGKIWEYEPFSNLSKPLNTFIIFSENDLQVKNTFQDQIKPLIRKKVVYIEDSLLPFEKWEPINFREFVNGKYEIIIVFYTENLVKNHAWEDVLEELTKIKNKHIFIFNTKDSVKRSEVFNKFINLPKSGKADSPFPDFAAKIAKDFENSLINITDK